MIIYTHTTNLFVTAIPELIEALKEVTDWFCLGIYLKISLSKLEVIEKNYRREGPVRCKVEMLVFWLNQQPRDWSEIVEVLVRMEMLCLAQEIAKCHSKFEHVFYHDS